MKNLDLTKLKKSLKIQGTLEFLGTMSLRITFSLSIFCEYVPKISKRFLKNLHNEKYNSPV